MSEQVIHLLPTFPQTWEARTRPDGRFTVTCPSQYLDSVERISRLNSSSTSVHLQRLLRKRRSSAILPKWMTPLSDANNLDLETEEHSDLEQKPGWKKERDSSRQIIVSTNASRHVFVHDVRMTMRHNAFLLVGDLFDKVKFERDDLNQTYFFVKKGTDGAGLSFCFVSDILGVPVYYLKGFYSTKLESVTIVDTVTKAEVCTVDQLGCGKRGDSLCIWRKCDKLPWVIVIANRRRTKFDFIEVRSDRVLLAVTRKSVPFAKVCNLNDQFDIHIAPFMDTALASLWVMLMARSFCM